MVTMSMGHHGVGTGCNWNVLGWRLVGLVLPANVGSCNMTAAAARAWPGALEGAGGYVETPATLTACVVPAM